MTITHLARHGGWFCSICKAYTGPTEATAGEPFAACECCGQRGVLRWHPPTLTSAETPRPRREPKRSIKTLP